MAERPRERSEMEFQLLGAVGGYCTPCLTVDKIGFGTWHGPLGIPRKQKVKYTRSKGTRSRRWTKHMAKTSISQSARDALTAKTAKENAVDKKHKQVANALEKSKAEETRDFSEMHEDSEDSNEDEQEDSDESDGGDGDD